MADWFQTVFERLEHVLLTDVSVLFAEALQVAEGVLIYETHQAEQLQQRVLQRRRR